ncbi:nadp-dependent alcohol dehydrogenase-like protein [Diplodia corticola]|uniref:Nadp-dependent alcohol dehydrogenase-like protein n=1 Tax=Diplodia corticola TaxID=236234 RepID=A0A1J9RW60_9PEZI|nr:nadp-dependent alcohol dehydrogenase-like protein [Diplodia corticola]OJD32615.1 nadp-dependent alcohol dehydrogenase-like protein [Diplodia corticola]
MAPTNNHPKQIPLLYRAFFTFLEPIFALNGAYLYVASPTETLQIITPPGLHAQTLRQTPIETMLLWQVASMYVLFALIELVVLRYVGPQRRDIWRLVLAAIIVSSDAGHLWALKLAADAAGQPDAFYDPRAWTRWQDWGNQGLTWFGFGLRLAFVAGVGL